MATYLELHSLRANSDLQDKVSVAVVKKAQSLIDSASPSSAQVTWAKEAIENPRSKALSLLNYVLAANSEASAAAITGASDSAIQSNVNDAVDAIVAGGV